MVNLDSVTFSWIVFFLTALVQIYGRLPAQSSGMSRFFLNAKKINQTDDFTPACCKEFNPKETPEFLK
ncbi:hypothetical protein [Cognataquiflexum rubidum]|uniref:hypothetical protein n=1 Tax=Cognataquiflexum rubidum TaxID=2922273 RepID=UPI001F13AD1D|nr:hypothetical protein [Cognataquiflexum rubidum]MCH6234454.1 hypothetical protein [Cognataquiflexum rubidum]